MITVCRNGDVVLECSIQDSICEDNQELKEIYINTPDDFSITLSYDLVRKINDTNNLVDFQEVK